MKYILFILIILWSSVLLAGKPLRLKFNPSGEFKIVQLTDTHLSGDEEKSTRPTFEMIREVLTAENPDLIVLTGDIVTTGDIAGMWKRLAALFIENRVPWAFVFGNHDDEHGLSREEIMEFVSQLDYSLSLSGPQQIAGVGNYILPVFDLQGKKEVALIYCLDSHSYAPKKSGVEGYAWLDYSQIHWYREQSSFFTRKNQGEPLPGLAFFHIPLPEYNLAFYAKDGKKYGDLLMEVCAPRLNSGMATAMLECGDVMGVFVGHDHTDDYVACWHNIALGYGRFSGGMHLGDNPGIKQTGARVIVLKQGKKEFDTWIYEKGKKEKIYFCSYPASFKK